MKNKIFNKIFINNKQLEQSKNDFAMLTNENEKLKIQNESFLKEIKKLENENKNLRKLNNFINFQEFLANSYVSPIVDSPFIPQDKRVFAFMDHLAKYLIQNTEKINQKPLISVILYAFNSENIIQNAINSVLNQNYENWELIIIVDGSDDNTLNLLSNFSDERIHVFHHGETKGYSYSCNIALKEAKGKYVMYLNSDNEWDSRYMETMVGAFLELTYADAIYSGQLLYSDYESSPYAIRFASYNKSLLHNRNFIDMGCFCHKMGIVDKIGGFDEELIQLSDWDYILRISNEFKVYSVPVLLSKHYDSNSKKGLSEIPFDYYSIASKILNKNSISPKNYKNLIHKVSIVIPSYESLAELNKCIESILSFYSNEMVDIIIVDNNSSRELKEYLKGIESKGIKIILNDINYGFSYAVEQGIKVSDENSDILILNNDAILTEGAIEHLQTGAYSYPDCGLIVPHEQVAEENHHMRYNVPYADKKFKCDVTPSKEHHNIINMPVFHDGELLELEFAPFFCTYVKREVYNQTLGLDPELGRHYRSDRIFSDFVRHILKLKIYQEPNAYVFHKHQVATKILSENKDEYDMMLKKNQWPVELAEDLGYKKPLWD